MSAAVFVDYYELLEVEPSADRAAIKSAYRARMLRDHADQNPDDHEAKERMILLTRAKEVLLDDDKRQLYDRERAAFEAAQRLGIAPPRWTGGAAPTPGRGQQHFEVDLSEVSLGKLLVGVGVAAAVTGLGFAAKFVAERANRKRRRVS